MSGREPAKVTSEIIAIVVSNVTRDASLLVSAEVKTVVRI